MSYLGQTLKSIKEIEKETYKRKLLIFNKEN